MVEPACGIPEERWIDWLSGALPVETREALERHLATCRACRDAVEEWRRLLEPEEQAALSPAADKRRIKLRGKVRRIGAIGRLTRFAVRGGAIAAAAALLLFGGRALFFPGADEPGSPLRPARAYAEQYEPNGAALMSDPDTVVYRMNVPERTAGVHPTATVWLNGRTEELFLLLEGLLPSDRTDVQAWGNVSDMPTNLGVLEFHQAQGHLYSRLSKFPPFEAVALTIEPKGGSERPTSPESATVRLGAE